MKDLDFLKEMYDDFFGIEKPRKNLNIELPEMKECPIIEISSKTANEQKTDKTGEEVLQEQEKTNMLNSDELKELDEEELKELKDERMKRYFQEIEKLYITEESKNTLKKIIEYLRKYNEKIEKEYIPFNMCVYSQDKDTIYKIVDIINASSTFFQYIENKEPAEVSLYDVEKADKIEEIYEAPYGVILFRDFEGLIAQDDTFKNKFWHKLEEKITQNPYKFLTILGTKNKETLELAFDKNMDIKKRCFNFEIVTLKPEIQEVYKRVLDRLQEKSNVEENFEVELLDYISITYPNSEVSYIEYEDKLCREILFNKGESITKEDLPKYEKDKTIDEVFAELNELVGLEKVKQMLQDLVSLIELKSKTKDYLKIKDTNLHMVFLGNPGTGKTTVARLVAQILYNLKYIKQNKLIEVSSKDLVAEYVGQTAPKTMAVIEKALGGVLFIDEAYSLASGSGSQGNSYNDEAIATLIQAMENYRDNLVVIFAGYTKEMQSFLNANSGIVSRIGYTMEFEDYTEDELIQILKSMLSKAGFTITKEAVNKAKDIIKEYKGSKNFGNARFVRNLYEKTVIKHASNTKNTKDKKKLTTIEVDDISVENLIKE